MNLVPRQPTDAGLARRISIRQLIGLLLVAAVVVAGLIFRITTLQLENASDRRDAQLDRLDDLGLGDEISTSAANLTRMANLYVATGDERFRRYHQRILDIRAGEAPRPTDYDADFWEEVIAGGTDDVELGEPAALTDLARDEDLTESEVDQLEEAIGSSDELAALERQVMARLEEEAIGGGPGAGELTSGGYHDRRAEIEASVDEFSGIVRGRTAARVAELEDRRDELLLARGVLLAVLGLVVAGALFVTARWIVVPLRRLTAVTRRIATGEYRERTKPGGVAELSALADDFNEMADAIERDMGRREDAERSAEEADQAKSEFLAVMSHELRTPMVGVSGTLDVLARTDLAPDQRELVEISQRSAASMLEIIGEVLDMSKIDAGRLTIVPSTTSLRNLLEDVVTQYRQAASEAGLVLSLEVDRDLAPAHVLDAERLRQVIANLLSNSVKFTPNGRIEVIAKALGEADGAQRVEIAVADTGIGIASEDQRRLFEPFRQIDASATRRVGGTGLGLVISREIVEKMGGELTLESDPATGTTVRVTIEPPVGDPGEIRGEPSPGAEGAVLERPLPDSADAAARAGRLLLLVEDHPVNRTVISTQLEAIGFRTDTAVDGVEGLERFGERDYAAVLADIHMPKMDGYELARQIRAREAREGAGRLPLVAVTASALHGELERCRAAGIDELITKPTTIAVLAERLHRMLPDLPWTESEPQGTTGTVPSVPSVPSVDDDELVDPEVLDEMTAGDAELAATLLTELVASTRSDLVAVEGALDSGDREALRREAHRIVGAARMVGAHPLQRSAERLEDRARSSDAADPELRELARAIATEADRLAAR